jgi:hypothetical protein
VVLALSVNAFELEANDTQIVSVGEVDVAHATLAGSVMVNVCVVAVFA